MSPLFSEHLKIFLSKVRLYLEGNSYINRESQEFQDIIIEITAIQNNLPVEKKNSTYKNLNLYISIIPTIVAAILTGWVFFFSLKNSTRNNRIQEVSMLKDSVINLSSQLSNTQKTLIRIDSLSKIDSTIRNLSRTYSIKNGDSYYGRDRAFEVILDKYLENIKLEEDLQQQIDSIRAEIKRKEDAL